MKILSTITILVLGLSAINAFACNCVNISGNPIYNEMCKQYGQSGFCGDVPNICLAVASCVNISGNPAYDQMCQQYGQSGFCGDVPNICQMVACH